MSERLDAIAKEWETEGWIMHPEDVSWLLAENERLRAALKAAKGLLAEITEHVDFEARPPERFDLYLAACAFLAEATSDSTGEADG